jgi:phosphatidylinositol glycan class V
MHNLRAHNFACQSSGCETGGINPLHFVGSYARIQERYWGVGILSYWHIKQIPNFLLSLPIYILSASTLIRRARRVHVDSFLRGRFLADPYTTHMIALLSVCGLVAHVEVSTRVLLSACPHLYFEAAFLTARNYPLTGCIVTYFIGYTLIGTALHANFFPWT